MILEEVKHSLRVDGSEDDGFLTSLIAAAKTFIENATGIVPDEKRDLDKLAITLLVTHWYENREVAQIGRIATEVPFSLEIILVQLKYVREEGLNEA